MNNASNNLPKDAARVARRLCRVRARVRGALRDARRDADEVRILAVSKRQSVHAMEAAFQAGQTDFGENYVQEARLKIDALQSLPIVWHFIGRLQANKTRLVAERFQWVHTVDRLRIARRLDGQRPRGAPPLQTCIQVDQAGEPGRGGVAPGQVEALARQIGQLPRIRLRGLMSIPPPGGAPDGFFRDLRELRDRLVSRGIPMDTLSMGMSADLEQAVAAGSTLVRIGTAIFGPRRPD